MAEQKEGPGRAARPTQSKKLNQSSGTERFATLDRAAQDWVSGSDDKPGSATGPADKTSATVVRRKQRYLIGFRSLPGMRQRPSDPNMDPYVERLAHMDGVEVIRRVQGRSPPKPALPRASLEMLVAQTARVMNTRFVQYDCNNSCGKEITLAIVLLQIQHG